MAEYRYSISLRVTHPTMDLKAVTDVLGVTPGVIRKAGEPRHSPAGMSLPGDQGSSFWTARLVNGGSTQQSLGSAIDAALDTIAAGTALFGDIAATGGRAEFFIGWFFDEGNSGDILTHALLARLAKTSLDLSFDVYADKPDGD